MPLKYKILAMGILPLLLAVAIIGILVVYHNHRLGEDQVALFKEAILSSKRAELQNYVTLALSDIAPWYQEGRGDAKAQEKALQVLAELNFGEDGYFFVFDHTGRNLMHPRQPELIGRDLWNLQDSANGYPIQALLHSASKGDGFQFYLWRKPSTGVETEKLAYVTLLDGWDWMLGTGIYLEDVERATHQVRAEAANRIRVTMVAIASVALVAVLLVSAMGLALSVREHRLADSKLQALNRRILHLQEDERLRVARELHDGISQQLVSIKFQFELAGHQLEAGEPGGMTALNQATERLGAAIGEIRRISHDLRPSLLDTLGLSAAIGQLVSEFRQRSGLCVHYRDELDGLTLPDTTAVALFRIVQEALANIERHADASWVHLALLRSEHSVVLQVSDDGVGFDPRAVERISAGIGLRNIRERAEHLGGTLSLSSTAVQTTLRVVLPASAV